MDPMTIGLLASAAISLIGRAVSEGNLAEARRLRQQMLDEYGPDSAPVLDAIVAQEVGPSAFEAIVEDPALRSAQTGTIAELRNVYDTEGNTPADQAAMRVVQNEVAGRAGSDYANNSIRLAQQGQQGNAVLSSALAANAGATAANATADMGLRAQVAARQRALQALMQSGQMAGDARGDDFRASSAKAGAQDRINQFNAGARRDAANQRNDDMLRQFGAKMRLADARSGVMQGQVGDEQAAAQRANETAAGLGNAAMSTGTYYQKRQDDAALLKKKGG